MSDWRSLQGPRNAMLVDAAVTFEPRCACVAALPRTARLGPDSKARGAHMRTFIFGELETELDARGQQRE